MSEIEKALKDGIETEDIHIDNSEREMLIDILGCVAAVLKEGKLHFNGKGKHNEGYANFCLNIARKFSNMKVHQEN